MWATRQDYDSESMTSHAQFRQYSLTQGRWMSPDPYGGSYDPANPQSFNRYSYVMNNPLAAIDPSGLNQDTNGDGGSGCDPATSACPPPSGQGSEGASGGPDYSGTPTSAPNGSQWQDQYGQYWTVQNGLLESLNTATDVGGGIPTGQADCMIFNCYIGSGLPIGFGSGSAPSNGLSKYEQSLPNCWAVGGRAVLQAGADTLGPLTDAAGAVKQLAEEGLNMASMYYNNKAAFYSATTVNTAGTVGLLVPLRSSIYRGLLSTSVELGEAASGATLALFDYNLGKQIYNEITNPTPCR